VQEERIMSYFQDVFVVAGGGGGGLTPEEETARESLRLKRMFPLPPIADCGGGGGGVGVHHEVVDFVDPGGSGAGVSLNPDVEDLSEYELTIFGGGSGGTTLRNPDGGHEGVVFCVREGGRME
jgi:hypothetical protein